MSAPKFLGKVITGRKQLNVLIAREVKHGRVKRLIESID
jgi:hypothetical protein